jgi:hypothetical protein
MRKAGDVLSSLFNEQFDSQLLKDARYYSGFFSAWSTLTGEIGLAAAAAHSRIADLDQGLLVIEVDHPGWKQILLTKQRQLLGAVQHRFPDLNIRGISFWLGKDRFIPRTAEHPQDSPGREAEDAGNSENPAEGDKTAASSIGDEDFKQSLKQLEKSFVKRNRGGAEEGLIKHENRE